MTYDSFKKVFAERREKYKEEQLLKYEETCVVAMYMVYGGGTLRITGEKQA